MLFMAYIKMPKMLVVKAYNKLRKLKNKMIKKHKQMDVIMLFAICMKWVK